jgi:putative sterol carrier protein
MPRYLSPQWVESFDAALSALDLTDAVATAGAGSLAAADGTFSVVQIVTGVPEDIRGAEQGAGADVHLVLSVAAGRARLGLDPAGTTSGTATIVLGYPEALAMARGELDPADALAAGRVRVRGDLAALVAGQDVLAEASARLGTDLEGLTDPADPADPAS